MGTLQYIAAIPPEAKTHNRLYIDLKCENVSTQMELGLFVFHFKCGRRVKDAAELLSVLQSNFWRHFFHQRSHHALSAYNCRKILFFVSGCFDKRLHYVFYFKHKDFDF